MGIREWFTPRVIEGEGRVVHLLQWYPIVRGSLYLVGAMVTVRGIVYVYDVTLYRGRETEGDLISRVTVLPCVLLLTWSFAKLRKEDICRWSRTPAKEDLVHLVRGAVLGTSGFLLVVGTAYALDWVHFSVERRESSLQHGLTYTQVSLGVQYAAVAWYEEMIYRGYGLDTALAAGPGSLAIPVLGGAFALGHGPGWQGLASHGAMALTATLLRLGSNSLWLPIGYHFAWNYVQTAILGPADGNPSLIPLTVDGPQLWMGQPGHAEPPGLLAAIAHAFIGLIYAVARWGRTTPPS